MKFGTLFNIPAPDGWNEIQEGSRHIFHGPNREELIVSASLVQGTGTTGELQAVQQSLFQNAEHSVKSAAAHSTLKVTQAFQRDVRTSKTECWTLLAQTREGDTLFHQALFRDRRGVLLATFESPNTANAANDFEQFIKGVEALSDTNAIAR